MIKTGIRGVPDYDAVEFRGKETEYCLLIPIINEGGRILNELRRARSAGIGSRCDIIICDGGSTDGSTDERVLADLDVNALLVKRGEGKQGAQLRTGLHFAMERGYSGVITIDGNDKDSIESAPLFIDALDHGYDLVQGSRFIPGGKAENTPLLRVIALRGVHAPVTSMAAGFRFTDTTNAFRAYSMEYLTDPRVAPLRSVFSGYELLAYLEIRAPQLGYRAIEVPVRRSYPEKGKIPTKISPFRGNLQLLKVLFSAALGKYDPDDEG